MFDAAQLKNVQLLHECQAGGGKLDFLATGIIAPATNAKICIECKCAHSEDLYHGIEEQRHDACKDVERHGSLGRGAAHRQEHRQER